MSFVLAFLVKFGAC